MTVGEVELKMLARGAPKGGVRSAVVVVVAAVVEVVVTESGGRLQQ
jgi:hypothetical protein